ncbi:MAG: hypothetical protein WC394_02875 [Candidatus Omnitrophota bacterium]|jgi:hypothetical protein
MSRAFRCNICKRFFDGNPEQELGLKEKKTSQADSCKKTTEIKDTKDSTSVLINYGGGSSQENINWGVLDFCPDCTRAFEKWRRDEEKKY